MSSRRPTHLVRVGFPFRASADAYPSLSALPPLIDFDSLLGSPSSSSSSPPFSSRLPTRPSAPFRPLDVRPPDLAPFALIHLTSLYAYPAFNLLVEYIVYLLVLHNSSFHHRPTYNLS